MVRMLLALSLMAPCAAALADAPTEPPAADEDTVILWHFDEAEGEVAADASGHGFDGAITGAEWVEGRFGSGLRWGEGNGNVSVPADLSAITDRFTLEAWIKLDAMPTNAIPFWAADIAGRIGSFVMTVRPPGVLYVGVPGGHLTGITAIPVGEWTHVALVYDGPAGKAATFVNGALDVEFDLPPGQAPVPFVEGRPFFARSYGGGDEKLVGAIDEVRLSNTVRLFGHQWEARAFLHVLRYRNELLIVDSVPPGMANPPVAYRVRVTDEAGRLLVAGEVSAEQVAAGRGTIAAGLPEGDYQVTVTAVLADGTEQPRVDRPLAHTPPDRALVDIDADNVYHHQGRPLFPLMAYHVRQKDLAEVASAGFTIANPFTITTWPGYERPSDGVGYIEAAWVQGMLASGIGGGLYASEIGERMLAHYRGHPGVAFWYIDDEPHGPGRQPEDMLARFELGSRRDPTHPSFLLHNRPPEFRRYAPACDIFATDSYPLRREGDTNLMPVAAWTRAAVDAVANRKPVWIALQCYTVRSTEASTAGMDMLPRLPTADELRCMGYLALAEGARGLLYYAFDDTYYHQNGIRGVNLAEEFPDFWAQMKGVIGELRAQEAIWTAPYADLDPPACDNQAIVVARYPLADADGVYVLAVNPTREAQALTLTFAERRGEEPVTDVLADRALTMRDGALSDTLAPLQSACYRLPRVG